jgi:myo-inositol-1(or 4)-monophosphatase
MVEIAALQEFTEAATEIAREAGQLLMARFRDDFRITHKGEINLVTEVDLEAEELIVSRLRRRFPDHSILAEEKGASERRTCHWIIDPLDGTTNFAHGFPVFAVSMGLEVEGELQCGVVYNPNLNEMFTGLRAMGAFLNGHPIRVSATDDLGASLLATGFPYDIRTSDKNNLKNFASFSLRAQAIRRAGSAALDLAYVAAGRFDGFWELKLQPWDCAAGYVLVREAGGMVTGFRGEPPSIYGGECLASNGRVHEQMLAVLAGQAR